MNPITKDHVIDFIDSNGCEWTHTERVQELLAKSERLERQLEKEKEEHKETLRLLGEVTASRDATEQRIVKFKAYASNA